MVFSCSISSAFCTFSKMALRKLTINACIVLSIVILSQLTLADAAGLQDDEESEDIVNALVENQNTTQNTTSVGGSPSSKGNIGAVVAASIIAVLACIAIVLGVYIFKRRRQSRMMDKEKKMQIQMSSARNAGIYQDLTVSVPVDDKPTASPEQERLKTEEA